MNCGNMEDDTRRFFVGKADNAVANSRFVEEAELAVWKLRWNPNAGARVQSVIVREAVFVENFIYCEATLAAERAIVHMQAAG